MRALSVIFKEEKKNLIYVNVSSGNKIQAIACMMACMIWNGTPYYVIPERFNRFDEPLTTGVKDIVTLPKYRIDKPETEIISCLDYIGRHGPNGVSKKQLITHLETAGLLRIPSLPIERKAASAQARYRYLEEHVIKPAHDWGFVREEGKTRNKRIVLTKEGKESLIVFGGML